MIVGMGLEGGDEKRRKSLIRWSPASQTSPLFGTAWPVDAFFGITTEPEGSTGMQDLERIYRDYIDCLNRQDWSRLEDFVAVDAIHNDRRLGLDGYRRMLESDFRAIPDLHFNIDFLVVDASKVASRLVFDCRPVGKLFDLPVNGRRIRFSENVFYRFSSGRIAQVWSVIDKSAIEAQLSEEEPAYFQPRMTQTPIS